MKPSLFAALAIPVAALHGTRGADSPASGFKAPGLNVVYPVGFSETRFGSPQVDQFRRLDRSLRQIDCRNGAAERPGHRSARLANRFDRRRIVRDVIVNRVPEMIWSSDH